MAVLVGITDHTTQYFTILLLPNTQVVITIALLHSVQTPSYLVPERSFGRVHFSKASVEVSSAASSR
jgi:hypothetical protein